MTTPLERPRRRLTRKARAAAYWADRMAAAPTPAARAVVAWDHVRTRITDLPDDAQEQAWNEVVECLAGIAAPTNSQSKFAREFKTQPALRPGARALARTREERPATTARNTPTRSTR
jgi:hypothetical protein